MQDSEARYHLLVTIRHYAQEKLRDAGEWSTVHDRYLSCILQRTEEIAPHLDRQHQEVWMNWLEDENDNIRAALSWAIEQRDTESGLRIAAALFQFWWVRSYIREGFTWYQRMLLLHEDVPIPLPLYINALTNAAFLAFNLRDPQTAKEWAQRAVVLCEAAGEAGKPLLGYALSALGSAAMAVGDVPTVFAVNERVLELICNDGDITKIGATHFVLGMTAMTLGKYDVAHTHLNNALAFAREGGNLHRIGRVLNSMGDLARCEERLEQARSWYEESLSLLRSLGDVQGLADTLRNLAVVCLRQGGIERAYTLLCESVERNQAQDDREALGHSLQGFATLAAVVGLAEESAQLLGWAVSAIGVELQGADKLEFDYCKGLIRQKLSEAAFERAWAKGQALPMEQAVALVLSLPLELDSTVTEAHHAPGDLTVREREIAGLIARGLSNGEIADALVLSKRTVEKHIANILSKMNFTNRAQIVRWAMKPE